jgi:pyrrolidone-carboxylate peptidase
MIGAIVAAGESGRTSDGKQMTRPIAALTVEEARLERLPGTDISLETLTRRVGQVPLATDSKQIADLGSRLWRAAVSGVQADEIWDDRPLYWARLSYAAWLREEANTDFLDILEWTSRGMNDVAYPVDGSTAAEATRVLVTGFDPFHLDRQIEQSNPSGLAALALDGRMLQTARGPAHVQAAVFPVRFADFDAGMVERFIEPFLNKVDLVVTISMGREGFDLERFPGRRRSSAVPDNLNVLTGANPGNPQIPRVPDGDLSGPEFLQFTLPVGAMLTASGEFPVRDNRMVATLERGDLEAPNLQALEGQTAVRGSGGGYLSNEIAYRTLLANERIHGSANRIPMGHIHTPQLTGFDRELERSIVAQIEAMLIAAVAALPER